MRVIAGDGHGEDRFDSDGGLLRLVHSIETAENEADVLRVAVEGVAQLYECVCAAIVLSPADGTLDVEAASSDYFEGYARDLRSQRLPLSADGMAADAVLTGSYLVERPPFPAEGRGLLAAFPGRDWVRAAASVSMHAAEGTIGVFQLFSDRETSFPSRRMEALRVFASIAALEFHRRRQLAGLIAQRADARAMLETAKELSRHTDEQQLLSEIAAHCRAAGDAVFAIAWVLDGNLFRPAAVDGDDRGFANVNLNADATLPLGQGPEGRSVRTGRLEYVKDVEGDRAFAPWLDAARRSGVRSVLALPLATGESPAVVIAIYAADVDAFDDAKLAHLEAYCSHARIALGTARAFTAVAAAARDGALRAAGAGAVSHGLDLSEVARSIAAAGGAAVGAEFAVTYVGDRDSMTIAGTWNAPPNLSVGRTINLADPSLAGYPPVQAARESRIVIQDDVLTDAQWLRQGWDQQALAHGFTSVVAAPLTNARQVGAIVMFLRGKAAIDDASAAMLARLGSEGAAAVESARKYDRARSARDFLNRVLEESTDAIVQIDLGGLVVGWNGGAERMFGLARDEAVGAEFAELGIVPPASRDDVRELVSRVARGEHVRALELVCRGREGESIDMLLSATPSRDEDGNIVGLVAFSKDITEQKKRYGALQEQNRRLAMIRDITRSFSREVGVAAVAQKGLEKLLETQRLDAGRIYVYDQLGSRLLNVAARGFTAEGCEPIDVRPSTTGAEGLLCSAAHYRQTTVLNDVDGQTLEHPHFAERGLSDVSSVLTKPLAIDDQLIGAIQVIGFDGRRLTFEDQSIFHAIGDELAAAMRGAEMLEEASRAAITDPLTGLYNYRFTNDFLKKRLSEARRRRRPFSVIMADIDGLQSINEQYGRAAGDDVLKQFARCLSSAVRLSDVVARYGGDEFIVLLPETQLGDALMLAERMSHAFTTREWEKPVEDLEMTAAMGCAAFPESGSNVQMLLKAADAALFQAKKLGPNAIFPRADTLPRFAG